MTIQESVQQWLALQRAFEPHSCSRRQSYLLLSGKRRLPNYSFGSAAWPRGRQKMANLFQSIQALEKRLGDAGISSV